jgi:putative ABC transport system permease protein
MTRHWLFSVAVVLLLGLGASVAIVMLSFADAVLFRPLPVPRPEELVRVVQQLPRVGIMSSVPEAYYDNLRARTGAFAFVFGETGEFDHFAVTSPLPAERVSVRGVTPDFFKGLGVQPRDGRLFNDSDSIPSSQYAPALLSYRLWQRRFAGTQGPPALGRDIIVNDQHFTIVGIMPDDFRGLTTDTTPDIWIPLSAFKSLVKNVDRPLQFQLAARLKSGLSLKQAEVECQTVWQSTMTDYYRNIEPVPEKDVAELVGRGVHLESLERGVSVLRNNFKTVLETILVASLFLLLAVCLTVGGLFTIRAVSRRLEFAVRYSLGASRLGLLRQLWIEGLLFAGAGGALGVIVAVMCLPLTERLLPALRDRSGALLPLTLAVTVDRPVVLIAGGGVLLASVVFLALTATGVSRANLDLGLRSVRTTTGFRVRSIIVILQVAVCTLLLLMAGVFVRTLMQLRGVHAGFDKDYVATFTGDSSLRPVNLDAPFLPLLLDRVRALPGVTSASIASVAVMRGRGVAWTVAPAGETITPAHLLATVGNTVSLDYVETMGMRVVQGRSFSVSDRDALQSDSAVPALVNQAFATRFFPSGNPLGKYFGPPANGLGSSRYVIVGVVSDAKYRSLREPIPLTFFALGWPSGTFVLNVRTSSAPRMILEPVQKVLASINPSLSFREVHTLDAEVDASMANERLMAVVVSTFAICAAIAAVAGIYGLMAYLAALRRREIAIRMALGATGVNIVQLMTRETLVVVLAGIVIGLAASRAFASVLQPMLFNTSATNPLTAVLTAMVVLVATFVATAGPIGRVAKLAPAQVLRE